MSLENLYSKLYEKHVKKSVFDIQKHIKDLQIEMEDVGGVGLTGEFKILNDSTNNMEYAVLVQLLEEKA